LDASEPEIKAAYHRALLRYHPDKNVVTSPAPLQNGDHDSTQDTATTAQNPSISLLKEAYLTLSTPSLRASYDTSLQSPSAKKVSSRPAHIVSLEDFNEIQDHEVTEWNYRCRCGGVYRIQEEQLMNDAHLIGCDGCSEVVWVGYEAALEDDDEAAA
jgi:diphthamide biosynthesis protein 4